MDIQELIKGFGEAIQSRDLNYLAEQKEELSQHRPFSVAALQSLEEKLEVDEVHNSTALEGNTLTLGETALVLTKGLTIGGKSLKEHLEVKGYDKAYQYIRRVYQQAQTIDEKIILEIHKLIFADFTDDLKKQMDYGIGLYRQQPVFIQGSSFVPPNYLKVSELMLWLVEFLNTWPAEGANAVKKALLAHFGLVTIHPFMDGNGRAARLLANLVLLNNGWPIIVVRKERRADYLNSLEAGQKDPTNSEFFNLMLELLQQSFNLYKELY